MLIEKTYDISPKRIFARKRGHFLDGEQILWFWYFVKRDGWRFIKCSSQNKEQVTLSDLQDDDCSLIQLDCPHIELINQKEHFVRLCGHKEWVPKSIVINLTDGNIPEQIEQFTHPSSSRIVFLKKAGPGIGGGYDVTPIIVTEDHFVNDVMDAIDKQNSTDKRYARRIFVLQEGVEHPLLTRRKQKTDLRLYMLIVGFKKKIAFYACKVGDLRNAIGFPYTPTSTDPRVQITNISQNSKFVKSYAQITRIFSRQSDGEIYNVVFPKFLNIVRDLAEIYTPYLIKAEKPFVTLIGLDAVIDSQTLNPKIVELNRRPGVYTPDEARKLQYSSTLFMRDVFYLGVDAIVNDTIGTAAASHQFVLVSRTSSDN